ncbi:hypothetical protein N7537_010170 [Penicillium hordei]|uniref:Uncharacterized protein n=1 Tax=Penicillium hordei TaxID=40994 RepID=A0AAD6GVG2_9EURO|nr:uncharacterized protein N7537_010170 [Penicillium hordei]KAJ5593266.1 hypothetical protein N7537_010170 [Penicillium hordei]
MPQNGLTTSIGHISQRSSELVRIFYARYKVDSTSRTTVVYKETPLRDSLDIYRYLSPISITPTLPPSNPIDPVSKSQNFYTYEPRRHPLPTRPPLELENLSFTTLTSPYAETFDSKDVL